MIPDWIAPKESIYNDYVLGLLAKLIISIYSLCKIINKP